MSQEFIPLEYQNLTLDHTTTRPVSALFLSMGLGKTVCTLKTIHEFYRQGRLKGVVIVGPIRVINSTWQMEVDQWAFCKGMKVANLRTQEGVDAWFAGTADIYLLNYEKIPWFTSKLVVPLKGDIPANMIVMDELHNAKNPSSVRIKDLRRHMHLFPLRMGLTGTPHPNTYIDLFAQIRLLDDGNALGTSIAKFKKDYFYNPDGKGFKWVLRAGAKEKIEEKISHLTITLSSEDWLNIPEVDTHDIEIVLDIDSRRKYNELEKQFFIMLEGGDIPAVSAAALCTKLLQLASGAVYDEDGVVRVLHDLKMKALRKLVDKIEGNVLVVYHFKHERDRIAKAFPEAEFFDEKRIGAWNNKEIKMWVAQSSMIKEGLNLQFGGHNLIWVTPTYNFALYDQLNARLARKGQTERTQIHRIICKDTYDEAAVEALRTKREGQTGLFQSLKVLEALRK
jgi:SNF2 family DNA or RNA helicase